MSFPAALWDLQELKTVGIILLLCFSFKLLHVLGIIHLTGGGGTKTVMGLQWGGDAMEWVYNGVGVQCKSWSLPPVSGQCVQYAGAAGCSQGAEENVFWGMGRVCGCLRAPGCKELRK